jgi:4-carboxymuconolactone decarboxylase
MDSLRIREINRREDLNPEDRAAFDSIVGPRGRLPLPFALLLNRPPLAAAVGSLGEQVRMRSTLPADVLEVAILATARETGCGYALGRHELHAKAAGVAADTVRSILEGNLPAEERARAVAEFARSLARDHRVSDEVHASARKLLGDTGVLELAATVGYYCLISCVTGAFEEQRG